MNVLNAPMPDLRIVETGRLRAHEAHDSQRSGPLIERLRHEATIINPPIVASLPGGDFVILDGANRTFALRELGVPHMLVQVAAYHDGTVQLDTWRHVVSDWAFGALVDALNALPALRLLPREEAGEPEAGIATLTSRAGEEWVVLRAEPGAGTNAALRELVQAYQERATLQRTALDDLEQVWAFHPSGDALVTFRPVTPADITRAALEDDFLPPGVSRHIVQGRAVRVNYPMIDLRDPYSPLERKNEALHRWTQERVAARRVRFYAESTFQFDE